MEPVQARALINDRFAPARAAYARIPGWPSAMPQGAITHHRIALYGPLCQECGKPLRTRRARFCAACGTPRA